MALRLCLERLGQHGVGARGSVSRLAQRAGQLQAVGCRHRIGLLPEPPHLASCLANVAPRQARTQIARRSLGCQGPGQRGERILQLASGWVLTYQELLLEPLESRVSLFGAQLPLSNRRGRGPKGVLDVNEVFGLLLCRQLVGQRLDSLGLLLDCDSHLLPLADSLLQGVGCQHQTYGQESQDQEHVDLASRQPDWESFQSLVASELLDRVAQLQPNKRGAGSSLLELDSRHQALLQPEDPISPAGHPLV
jgi:hypothetical protein